MPVGIAHLGTETLVFPVGEAEAVPVQEGHVGSVAVEAGRFGEQGPSATSGSIRADQEIAVTDHEEDGNAHRMEIHQAVEDRVESRITVIIPNPGLEQVAEDIKGGRIGPDGSQPAVGSGQCPGPSRIQVEVGDEIEGHPGEHDSRCRRLRESRPLPGSVNMAGMPTDIRLRFAPSPTGAIHLGNARTALFNFLEARHAGGTFLVRIEDTDRSRSDPRREASLLSDLRWLGLDWAEGPDVGGSRGPYRQSERSGIYARYLAACFNRERVYPCFCTMETLAQDRALQVARGQAPRYTGRCGTLSRAEGERRLAQGEQAVWRWRVAGSLTRTWQDLVFGTRHINVADLGDFVISRTDGSVGFLFANAVDDLEMGVSHVLRGEDHLSNTTRQILIFEGLDSPAPHYGHLPLLVNPGGAPLAKRAGALSIGDLRMRGFLPDAVRNYLARLGHPYAAPGLLGIETLIQEFGLGKVGRARAVLDPEQLAHWQKLALAALAPVDFAAWGAELPGGVDPTLAALVRENIVDYEDLMLWRDRLTGQAPATPGACAALAAANPALLHFGATDGGDGDHRAFLERFRSAYPGSPPAREVYPVLRAVLTGSLEGPELARLWAWFSPEMRRQRFAAARRAAAAQSQKDPP